MGFWVEDFIVLSMRYLSNGSIRVPEDAADLTVMWDWLSRQHTVAVDTETTGLDIYADHHRLRLIAIATPKEAWVFPWETFQSWTLELVQAFHGKRFIMHNASYDIQVLAKHVGINPVKYWERTRDTKILAHQIDPRGRDEGGIGQSLDELVKHYMPEYAKLGDELKEEFILLKNSNQSVPKNTPLSAMWSAMPIDNPMYLLYAGTDAMLTARLFQLFGSLVDVNSQLTRDDHKVAMIASLMDAQGFLLDVEYTEALQTRLFLDEAEWKVKAHFMGCANINSGDQVAEALKARGFEIVEKTPTGRPKVDKVFFAKHMDDALVQAIVEGKKAGKWRTTWVEKFRASADRDSRVHPSTNTLRARTARFSITGIPAQTLPSSDALIRSCFVADTGQVVVGVDYSQQELRFAAAHSKDPKLMRVFREGADPYLTVAELVHPGNGMAYRKQFKTGVLGTLYGAGTRALMDQTGMTFAEAKAVIETIRKGYGGLDRRSKELAAEAEKFGYITTWTGRRLPVEPHRLYSAMNYYTQSGARDLTAQAMIRLYDNGFLEYMRLVIHDEILFSMPNDPELIRAVEALMSTSFGRVKIPAEAKVGKRSWGSLYEKAA